MTNFTVNTTSTTVHDFPILPSIVDDNSSLYGTLIEAIAQRRIVKLWYQKDRLLRSFSPYLLRSTLKGQLTVIGMQNSNENSLDGDNEPRQFTFSKITKIELTDEKFVPIDTFSPSEKSHSSGIIVFCRGIDAPSLQNISYFSNKFNVQVII